jgi:hypothetical protein
MIACPHCSLANPDGAQHCDCGWDFTSSRMKAKRLSPSDPSIKQKIPKWTIFLPEIVLLPIALLVWSVQRSFWLALALVVAIPIVLLVLRR